MTQQGLTQKEIDQRLAEIGNKYSIGEFLSDEDADFVRTYASKPSQGPKSNIGIQAVTTGDWEGAFGTVELTGYTTIDIGIINNSISGNMSVRDTEKTYHKSIGSVVELRCFGVFGEGGTKIGLVYSKDYSNSSSNSTWNRNTFSDNFVASVAYWNIEARGLVDGNSFSTTYTKR